MNSKYLNINLPCNNNNIGILLPQSNNLSDHYSGKKQLFIVVLTLLILITSSLPLSSYATDVNDTGVVGCANETVNGLSCPQIGFPNQDAEHGRDFTVNDDTDGHAGFSYTKLDLNGDDLAANATQWSCVRDNVSQLIWEVKTSEVWDFRDKTHDFTWYNSTGINDGGSVGEQSDNGECDNWDADLNDYVNCNTEDYVEKVNAIELCGANDWRLPTRRELTGLLKLDQVNSAHNNYYFPNTRVESSAKRYWTSSPSASGINDVWSVGFYTGETEVYLKASIGYTRLVRSAE